MSQWHKKTQAQIFCAKKELERAASLQLSGASVEYRVAINSAVLTLREAWLCWLNELAALRAPKQKPAYVSCLTDLERMYGLEDSAIAALDRQKRHEKSWVAGFIELERAYGLADIVELANDDKTTKNELFLRTEREGPLSIRYGIEDMLQMLTGLKDFIFSMREQHAEW